MKLQTNFIFAGLLGLMALGNCTADKTRPADNSEKKLIDSLKHELSRQQTRFAGLTLALESDFISIEAADEDDAYGFNYRAEIYLSEIYNSLYISRIEYYSEGVRRVGATKEVNIEGLFNINSEQTSGLEFLKRISPTEFEVGVH